MNLEGRPREIFVIVVGEFIKTARPVGSEFLAENYDLDVSSATIRNDLAFLESLGFLNKPHPSGGRVPTAHGWHYFMEEVWEPSYLKEEDEALKFENSISNLKITTDIIVGFCGETDKEFKNTVKLCKKARFEKAYISRYSKRPMTSAAKNLKDDISPAVKKQRWQILEDLINNPNLRKNHKN